MKRLTRWVQINGFLFRLHIHVGVRQISYDKKKKYTESDEAVITYIFIMLS